MPSNLTNTTTYLDSNASITFDAVDAATTTANQDVKIIYPTAATDFRITTAIVPPGSKFHPGAHWHEDYDEIMRVIKGRLSIRLGREWKTYTPEDGEILIKRGVVHDLMRADAHGSADQQDEGDVVVEERSEPVDGAKELFFRHVFSINADSGFFGWKIPLQMLLTLFYSDVYMDLVPGPASWYISHGLRKGVVGPLAGLLGLKPFYDEYTPERLVAIRKKLEGGEEGKKDL